MTRPNSQKLGEALDGVAARDERAFRVLYDLSSPYLFAICRRICADRHAAEDVLHDVYLTIWRVADSYRPERAAPMTWLATIARNRAIDWRRQERLHDRRRAYGAGDDVLRAGAAADEAITRGEEMRRLHDCLDQLEDNSRRAIREAFFTGASYPDLAARADVPLPTMKSWIRRGLLRLRRCLEGVGLERVGDG